MNSSFHPLINRFAAVLCLTVMTVSVLFATDNITKVEEANLALGVWISDNGNEKFEIYKKGDLYYGKIVWVKYDTLHGGDKLVDTMNPDPEKRDDSIVGLEILSGFKYKGKGVWTAGRVYDPGSGKTYKCRIKVYGDTAEVRGYILVPLLGRTETAHRVKY